MRLDRLLTLYFFGPLAKLRRANEGVRIPILMYHSISDRDADVSHPYFQTNTLPEIFAQQMQYLADNNYKVIPLSEAISLIGSVPNPGSGSLSRSPKPESGSPSFVPKPEAPRNVVITFDDAHRDFHDVAWPILKKYGYPATMFLPTGFVDNERKHLNGKDCLTWDEVKALAGEGVAFGAHTVTHVQLYELFKTASKQPNMSFPRMRESTHNNLSFPRRQESMEDMTPIEYELRASRVAIEKQLGKPVDHYAYALAFPEHDEKFVRFYEKSLREAGYLCALTTRIGAVEPGDNPYMLKRIPLNSHDDEDLLQAKLEGGYAWLYKFQYIKKKMSFAG